MASAENHAKSSAKHFGGQWEDYFRIHDFFDNTKVYLSDFRHRALRHHDVGIEIAVALFGAHMVNADLEEVSVLAIGQQHMYEDFDRIPTWGQWWPEYVTPDQIMSNPLEVTAMLLKHIQPVMWMSGHAHKLSVA